MPPLRARRRGSHLADQEPEEERCAKKGSDHTYRQLGWEEDEPGGGVAEDEEGTTKED